MQTGAAERSSSIEEVMDSITRRLEHKSAILKGLGCRVDVVQVLSKPMDSLLVDQEWALKTWWPGGKVTVEFVEYE